MNTDDGGRSLPDHGPPDACLGPEVLSAFLDGTLQAPDKSHVQAHLATCSECYALFSESAGFLRETALPRQPAAATAVAPPVARRTRVETVLAPLAAAAIVAFVLLRPSGLVAPTVLVEGTAGSVAPSSPPPTPLDSVPASPAPAPPPSVDVRLVHLLIDGQDLRVLAGAAWRDDPVGLGFAGGGSRERALVLAGVHLLDLEVAIRGGHLAVTRERLAGLAPLAESLGEGEAVRAFGLSLTEQRLGGLDTYGLRAQLEGPHRASGDAGRLIRFGEWVEASRLAAVVRHSRYFAQTEARAGLLEARELPLAEPTRRPLAVIESLLQTRPASEAEWRQLERNLLQILLLL